MISPLVVARAYAAAGAQAAQSVAAPAPTPGPSFAEVLKGSLSDAVAASRHAETQMVAHTQGRGDLVSVVTAVASAQASLETVMAVRDQVINAYQEIMRMPI